MTPLTPAHVLGCDGRAVGPRCAHTNVGGRRCFNAVDTAGDFCLAHADRLPRELVVLRDPRTGEPLEVT